MTPAAALELALVTGSLATGATGAIAALRTRAVARDDRLALRLARAHEGALVESARRLADAARASVDAVREEIARAARVVAPAVDGVLLYEEHEDGLCCVYATGERLGYFAGSRIARDDTAALPVMALGAGHRITLSDGARPLHPRDTAALAVPLAQSAGRACILVVCARTVLDAQACERLVTLADQASPAYAIALDRENDRRRAEFDGLTGLLTPRAFRQRLAALTERARHVPTARYALLFLDTDRFKLRAPSANEIVVA